ncbi:alpha-L-rhamnosidase C-terminal domain-containing protein [Streptomyces sp. 3214.6]|uniref:alpha-L-rhamnosidase C-terminal domain-containing protein n=1 Tax=Streptomyces sp. 3214.6 TaxID=1882757 RepID=UPI00156DBA1D|nr:alpha-L-rhamnosidase C-terminal domain-containing protein [Streptomyces sp. 3214.6]
MPAPSFTAAASGVEAVSDVEAVSHVEAVSDVEAASGVEVVSSGQIESDVVTDHPWPAEPPSVHVPSDRGRSSPGPAPLLRREFDLPAEPVSARLTSAGASLATPYGTASVDWSLNGTTLTVDVTLPPGTTGRFSAPEGWRCTTQTDPLESGAHRLILHSASAA